MRKLLILVTALALTPLALTDATAAVHFQLSRSAPADEAVLEAPPTEVQLWFSQEPQMEGARIVLLDGDGDIVPTGPVEQGAEDRNMIHTPIEGSVGDGDYSIRWRAMAQDGHVVDGTLTFSVAVPR